ncbi:MULTISPECIES: hypothetical protein [Streptomyces]|uniref:hypothetical protein n=1 Tax=Streptomyces TaxID=1883 RepID=UPI0004BD4DD5|nr:MULTISPECIES: hypothetical protein [Streptomyces]KOU12821.1 hypothetical protein ADK49_27590 [Streptomyces sp. WM6349]KOU91007.1 hypothetical protein ADK92_33080 [Streptomyces sp. XY533]KOU91322.1 hypothetical protein ADK94_07995 [Streptomyces sp. XY593]KOV40406.1 hypothetical protein ADK98_29990 [Streptomyces sp. H036]MCI4079293.1 hypothetical protein [Streptomyces sp. MMS21 TC-5]
MTLDELPLAPVSTRPDEATDGYVVALDAAGVPTGLGVAGAPGASPAASAAGGSLPPAVLLPARLTLDELLTSEAVTLLPLNPFGAVVIGPSGILGVLEHPTIARHCAGVDVPPGRTRSDLAHPEDGVLAGVVGVPVARLLCRCGRLNQVTLYDPDYPPACPGDGAGHPLEPQER